jgi:hypothetical protein
MSIKSDVLSYRIPRGYMIVCSSWENDGDHSQTNVVGGLTKESAQLKYDLLNAITDSGCENIYEPDEFELGSLKNAVLEVANNHGRVIDTELGWECFMWEEVIDLHGRAEFYTRCIADVQIYYVPFDVEFPNVTDQFAQ